MIDICISSNLKKLLNNKSIDIKDYLPAYNGESAGLDLYNSGNSIDIMPSSGKYITKEPNLKVLISTGLKVSIPKGYVGLIQERGSIIKTPLKVRAGVIDSGYNGEIFVNCVNISSKNYRIHENEKLPFQLVVVKCDNEYNLVTEEEYLNTTSNSSRKAGKIGSSD